MVERLPMCKSLNIEFQSLTALSKCSAINAGGGERFKHILVEASASALRTLTASGLPAGSVDEELLAEGLEDNRFRLEAVGPRELLVPQAMTEQEHAENRRVDIILTERHVDVTTGD